MRRDEWLLVAAPLATGAAVVGIFWAGGHDILSRSALTGAMLLVLLIAPPFAWGLARRATDEYRDEVEANAMQLEAKVEALARIEMVSRRNAWRQRLMESTALLNASRDLVALAVQDAPDGPRAEHLRKFATLLQEQSQENGKVLRP